MILKPATSIVGLPGAVVWGRWLAGGFGWVAAVLLRTVQVASRAQHLHEPNRTATAFGWDRYWICGLVSGDGRWAEQPICVKDIENDPGY